MRLVLESFFISWGAARSSGDRMIALHPPVDLEQGWVPEAKKGLKKETEEAIPFRNITVDLANLDSEFWEGGTSEQSEQAKKSLNHTSVLPPVKVLKAAADDRLVELQLFLNSSDLKCLSGADVTRRDADIVAQWLPHFSSLTLLDISDNPLLGDAGVACILSAITGACTWCS
jgi:hypothetical protein